MTTLNQQEIHLKDVFMQTIIRSNAKDKEVVKALAVLLNAFKKVEKKNRRL